MARKPKQQAFDAPGMQNKKHKKLIEIAEEVRELRQEQARVREKLDEATSGMRTEIERLIEAGELKPADGYEFKQLPILRYDVGEGPKVIRYGKHEASVSVGDAKNGGDGIDVVDAIDEAA